MNIKQNNIPSRSDTQLCRGLQLSNFRRDCLLIIIFLASTLSYVIQSAPITSVAVASTETNSSISDTDNSMSYSDQFIKLQGEWNLWKVKHNKAYSTIKEESRKFLVWMDNLMYIEEHNRNKEKIGFSLGMNVFGDQTFQDWGDLYKCHQQYNMSGNTDSELYSQFTYDSSRKKLRGSEEFVDWRDKGVVTEVKSQEDYRCHSCYAFAGTGALESAHALSTKNLVSLSEQQVLDCSKAYSNAGCHGGNYKSTWRYIIKNRGIDTYSYYPYKSVAGACMYSRDFIGATMSGMKMIEEGNEEALREAVETVGPVAVTIDHLQRPFQFYREGIYSYHGCNTDPRNATHEMVVVGYGTDSNYGMYWILKNSYGTTWGVDGYMQMLRGANTCGVASDAGIPVV